MTFKAANPPLAIAFMLAATAFIAGTMLAAKSLGTALLGPPLHPFQVTHGRFIFAWLAIATVLAIIRPPLQRPHFALHIGRTAFGFFGVTCMFAAVAYIPLTDATAISFLNPVMGMLLAIPLLGEKVGRWRWMAAGMALLGAMVLLRPGPGTFQVAALLALAAAMLLGMELIFIKKLANRESSLQILFVNNSLGVAIASIVVLPFWAMPTPAQWGALAALGLMMAAAQACFVNAMARADASLVTPFSYVSLIFVTLYDLVIFDVFPDAISWTGVTIILASAALLAWREQKSRPKIAPATPNSRPD